MITKVTFVSKDFVRKPPKYERFIRPTGLRFKKAHVTHPELKTTFCLDILGVKKNPQSAAYTSLGVITKGTVLEVNVSELGLVTQTGKVVWGKYAQVTNKYELTIYQCQLQGSLFKSLLFSEFIFLKHKLWNPSLLDKYDASSV